MAPAGAFVQHQNSFRRRYRVLLASAKQLREQNHNAAAIVTAQTACELCTEIVLFDTFNRRQIGYLADPVGDLLPNYNLAKPRVRRVYEAATGDTISQQPFWPKFVEHVTKRNRIVHRGAPTNQDDADAALTVVEEVIGHIQAHYTASRQTPETGGRA